MSVQRLNPSPPQQAAPANVSILALDLGQNTGWALRDGRGVITSGTQQFKPGRFEGGVMPLLRFVSWLDTLRRAVEPLGGVFFEEVRAQQGDDCQARQAPDARRRAAVQPDRICDAVLRSLRLSPLRRHRTAEIVRPACGKLQVPGRGLTNRLPEFDSVEGLRSL